MRSIIDEIALAEEQAEQIRQAAAVSARELLAAARVKAEENLVFAETQEREKMREELEKAEADGREQAETILKELADAAEAQCANASLRIDDAVNYLMQKVQEIA